MSGDLRAVSRPPPCILSGCADDAECVYEFVQFENQVVYRLRKIPAKLDAVEAFELDPVFVNEQPQIHHSLENRTHAFRNGQPGCERSRDHVLHGFLHRDRDGFS